MMTSLIYLLYIFSSISLSVQSWSDQYDQKADFCRRFAHQTSVIDNKLIIDGGFLNFNPISQHPHNYSNGQLVYHDLDAVNTGEPKLFEGLNKPSEVPNLNGAVLWTDETNKYFYQFGGEYNTGDPGDFALWRYDALFDKWDDVTGSQNEHFQRVSYGSGVSSKARAEGYYLGGYLNAANTPGWEGDPMMMSDLIRFDFGSGSLSNNTGPDSKGRAEGTLQYLDAGDAGLLVYFGGVVSDNGVISGASMEDIYVFDMASQLWYMQKATGEIPESRGRFGAGIATAPDSSSYNIYLYGGRGLGDHQDGYDDAYILSMPSFTWYKYWGSDPSSANPHHSMSANVIDNAQMIIIGGTFPTSNDCDLTTTWGSHNLNLAHGPPQNVQWQNFIPNITYSIPPGLTKVIGGDIDGGATATAPADGGFTDRNLGIMFSRIPSLAPIKPTRAAITGTPESDSGVSKTVVIAASTVGAVVAVIVGLVIGFCCLRRRAQRKMQNERSLSGPMDPLPNPQGYPPQGYGGWQFQEQPPQEHYPHGQYGMEQFPAYEKHNDSRPTTMRAELPASADQTPMELDGSTLGEAFSKVAPQAPAPALASHPMYNGSSSNVHSRNPYPNQTTPTSHPAELEGPDSPPPAYFLSRSPSAPTRQDSIETAAQYAVSPETVTGTPFSSSPPSATSASPMHFNLKPLHIAQRDERRKRSDTSSSGKASSAKYMI